MAHDPRPGPPATSSAGGLVVLGHVLVGFERSEAWGRGERDGGSRSSGPWISKSRRSGMNGHRCGLVVGDVDNVGLPYGAAPFVHSSCDSYIFQDGALSELSLMNSGCVPRVWLLSSYENISIRPRRPDKNHYLP